MEMEDLQAGDVMEDVAVARFRCVYDGSEYVAVLFWE